MPDRARHLRCAVFLIALLCLSVTSADTFDSQSRAWSQRAAALGINAARLVIEYSLADDCSLANIRVLENSARDVLDAAAISTIVAFFVGPFAGGQRTIYWPTELGHHYIRCEFQADGSLAEATLTGNRSPAPSHVADRRIDLRLSTLGSKTRTVTFAFRNGSLTWTAAGS